MRSDRRKREAEEKQRKSEAASGFYKFTRLWSVLFLLATVAFGAILVYANILPSKYLLIVGLALLLLFVVLFPPLFKYDTKKTPKAVAFIVSLLIVAVYALGIRYLSGTIGFMSKITTIGSTEEYYVVVRDDDVYNVLSDLEGQTVYANRAGARYEDAIEKLTSEVSVEIGEIGDPTEASSQLLEGGIEAVFFQSAIYDAMREDIDSFDDYTKILSTIKVDLKVANIRKPVEVSAEAFNLFITGIDTTGAIDVVARSDVNMVMTVNPGTHTILLTSIPRDYYVKLPDKDEYDKLTHTGIYGSDYTVETVENLLGIDINYYAKVNFSTVELLVDSIGGIEVYSDYSFTSWIGDFDFVEGVNYLDGERALAFARERYAFEDGDFQRNKNQQLVMRAILSKVTQSSTILTNYVSILDSIGGNMETNMTSDELKELVRMQASDMSSWEILTQNIVGSIGYAPCYTLGNIEASVVFQNEEDNISATEMINGVFSGQITE